MQSIQYKELHCFLCGYCYLIHEKRKVAMSNATLVSFAYLLVKFGARLGSYLAPAETWIIVIRILVGKNFSWSVRL